MATRSPGVTIDGGTPKTVRTVLGDVDQGVLGHTQPHEHLLCDLSPILRRWGVQTDAPGQGFSADGNIVGMDRELPAGERQRLVEPIRLDNYDWIRRNVFNWDNLQLLSEEDAIAELQFYRAAGGVTLVESTPVGMGRDASGYARIARATGVHLVMGSGYYLRDYHPRWLDDAPEDAICDEILHDLNVGVGETGIRSGLIGEIGLSWPVHPVEAKVLRAACAAQVASGAPLQIHPGRNRQSPMEAIRAISKAGGIPQRTIMSHIDRTLADVQDMVALARTGCYLEFDLFGQESSYYVWNLQARRPNDATRVEWLKALLDAGFGDRVLVSQDICQKVYLRRYGGPGYAHILENVIPLMLHLGMSRDDIRRITVENPAAILAMER